MTYLANSLCYFKFILFSFATEFLHELKVSFLLNGLKPHYEDLMLHCKLKHLNLSVFIKNLFSCIYSSPLSIHRVFNLIYKMNLNQNQVNLNHLLCTHLEQSRHKFHKLLWIPSGDISKINSLLFPNWSSSWQNSKKLTGLRQNRPQDRRAEHK